METTTNEGYDRISEYYDDILDLVKLRLALFDARKEGSETDSIISDVERLDNYILRRNELTVENRSYIPLEYICGAFGLSPFERHCVLISVAMEIDSGFLNSYQQRLAQPLGAPSAEFAIWIFAANFSDYISTLSLFTQRKRFLSLLFDISESTCKESSFLQPLKLRQRVIDFIFNSSTGLDHIPCKLFLPYEPLDECIAETELSASVAYYIKTRTEKAIVVLEGEKGSGRKYHIKRYSAGYGMPVIFVDSGYLLYEPNVVSAVKSLCLEAFIQQATLCLTDIPRYEANDSDAVKKIKELLLKIMEYSDILFITTTQALPEYLQIDGIRHIRYRTVANNAAQRKRAWSLMTEGYTLSDDVNFGLTANKYLFTLGYIRSAAELAWEMARLSGVNEITESILNAACKEQISHSLDKRAVQVNAHYTWDELILPAEQKEMLRNACNHLKFRDVVYEKWNFKKKMAYGGGLSMLFSGPPGTGKTMAAQVIASDVNLDLYKVDLSSLVSKYIGETEKNLAIVFDEVKKSHSILFFDEADSIFGKRGEQRDSNDRFANIQTSYLLQRFEDYDGIVILATNFVQNFDDAFLRRIKFKVDFPFPDEKQRKKIWESLLICEAPFEDLDLDFLSKQFTLSGSSIKNVIINSAFLAASQNTMISMKHILFTIKAEYNKTNKIILKEELKEYAELF